MPGGVPDLFPGYPGFPAGVTVSFLTAIVAFIPLAHRLGIRRPLAFLLWLSIGLILAATLFPDILGMASAGQTSNGAVRCDLGRFLPSPRQLLELDESTANAVLFFPLGVAVALLPSSYRRVAIGLGLVLPFGIELVQLLAPQLDRACQTADIADNLTGFLAGLAGGSLAAWLVRRRLQRHPGRARE